MINNIVLIRYSAIFSNSLRQCVPSCHSSHFTLFPPSLHPSFLSFMNNEEKTKLHTINNDSSDNMKSSRDFHHPYKPYDIQLDFMTNLYDALDNYKVGIFESPTGTGKTLSLICASMTWLRDFKRNQLLNEPLDQSDEPEWIRKEAAKARRQEYETRIQEFEEKLAKIREIEKRERQASENGYFSTRKKAKISSSETESGDLDQFVLTDMENTSKKPSGISTDVQKLLDKLSEQNNVLQNSSEPLIENPVKIFFASRTHSQLSQFIGQLKMTKFPSSTSTEGFIESIKEVPLGSRKQLCIHPKISALKSVSQINDACLDLQASSTSKCEFLKTDHTLESRVELTKFQNKVLSDVHDIEDLAEIGKKSQLCPYYGIRGNVINQAEIIVLPYQLLLQKSFRQSLGIDVKDSVVIIDEAHNLLDVISSIHSASISASEVERSLKGLGIYQKKFNNRLSSINRSYLSQTINVVKSLRRFLDNSSKLPLKETNPGTKVNFSELFGSGTGDTVNAYKLEKFLQKSKLAFKLDRYLEKLEQENGNSVVERLVLAKVIQFLSAITNPSAEGKIFFGRSQSKELTLEYLLLDPSEAFRDIVEDARCVALAGGTMEPISDYLEYLFPYVKKEKIKLFSCGHIIPKRNLQINCLNTGFGERFLFTFGNRTDTKLHQALGKTILELASSIPKGIVVFFPSYQHLNILNQWKSDGILSKLEALKAIFTEPKDGSVDSVLHDFDQAILKGSGGILFSVVGGKMSEGINFSDDRARAVIMIGLPFPNMFSAEMTAKRQHIETKVLEKTGSKSDALNAAKEFYENSCMRSVNQSIGRAIRHIKDYSAVILIDERYSQMRIQKKLPGWIRKSMDERSKELDIQETGRRLKGFYREHGY